jgi:hypothetical protein
LVIVTSDKNHTISTKDKKIDFHAN